jgi:hypothetical protein
MASGKTRPSNVMASLCMPPIIEHQSRGQYYDTRLAYDPRFCYITVQIAAIE